MSTKRMHVYRKGLRSRYVFEIDNEIMIGDCFRHSALLVLPAALAYNLIKATFPIVVASCRLLQFA